MPVCPQNMFLTEICVQTSFLKAHCSECIKMAKGDTFSNISKGDDGE